MKRRTLILLALPLFLGGCGYNSIQNMDERAAAAQKQISVQLQRRADLVPNLVNTVKGFAAQEAEVYETVAKARAGLLGAVTGGNVPQMAAANQNLTGALGRLLAISENYPTLKSDQSFLRLQDELTGTENRIAVARTDYNQAVQDYNAYIRKFPAVLTAKVTGAKPRDYFDVTNPAAREVPTVDFSKKP
ncbi:MAG TPA: LemA family protein [Gemmatimonadaceae bacterium]|jgi:LemA protein